MDVDCTNPVLLLLLPLLSFFNALTIQPLKADQSAVAVKLKLFQRDRSSWVNFCGLNIFEGKVSERKSQFMDL